MNKVVDLFSSVAGWTYSGFAPVPVYLNYDKNLMSGINDRCAAIYFSGDLNQYVEKTYNVDVTGYTEIHLFVHSINGQRAYSQVEQFRYKIDYGFGTEYFMNTRKGRGKVIIKIPAGQTTLSKIKITCLHSDSEYLYISAAYAVKPEPVKDILDAICTSIGDIKVQIGTVTTLANDTFVSIINPDRDMEPDMLLEFGTERHQIKYQKLADKKIYFNDMYSGEKVIGAYANEPVYLLMASVNSNDDSRIIIPGILVSEVYREPKKVQEEFGEVYDTYTATTVQVRDPDHGTNFIIQIDILSEDKELLIEMEKSVLKFIFSEGVIVHGKYIPFDSIGSPVVLDRQIEGMVPKKTYRISVFEGVNECQRQEQPFPVRETVKINPGIMAPKV